MNQPLPLRTFVIYSSADRRLRDDLVQHLKPLVDTGFVHLWSDKEILPGELWDAAIKKQLLDAELFLMLISADFFNSTYIREQEFRSALEKLERGEAIVIPVIVRDCDWEAYDEIQKLQVLPPGGTAVTDLEHWKNADRAWASVSREIRRRILAHREQQAEKQTQIEAERQRQAEEKAAQQRQKQLEREQKAAEQAAREQRDRDDHAQFAAAKTRADFENYLKKGYSLHADEARERIDFFKKEEAAAAAEALRLEEIRQRKRAETERIERERAAEEAENRRLAEQQRAAAAFAERQKVVASEPSSNNFSRIYWAGVALLVVFTVWTVWKKCRQTPPKQNQEIATQPVQNLPDNIKPTENQIITKPETAKTIPKENLSEKVGTTKIETPAEKPTQKPLGQGRKSGFEIVKVQGGTFQMGTPASEEGRSDDECQHPVSVASFSIGKYEVTQADWREVMGENPPELRFKGCDQCPVENVSWNDIREFLKQLNARTGLKYRLPTEAEWEFAARGGNKSKGFIYAGSNDLGEVAWFSENSESKTHPVGSKKANELGVFDMSGNVWEWCQDTWKPYPCDSKTKADGSDRVIRGGGWNLGARYCRAASRYANSPGNGWFNGGFRLALSLQSGG